MPASAQDTVSLLEAVPAFRELGREELEAVAAVAMPRRFAAGEIVFRERDDSDTCYIVRSGHARALREHAGGRQLTLATFGPGDIFGELAMFDDERRSATVEALDDLEVLAILGGDMRRLMHEHAAIAVKLAVSLVRRLRGANERLASQSFQTVQSRVAAVLAQLVEQAQAEGAPARDVPDHRHPGGPRQAGGLLARVGQPLPRRARARRRDLAGPRTPGGARPGGARRLCLLSRRRPTAAWWCAAAR